MGAHLQHCINFECNMMFKCSKSYCIPWLYVCNGKWDCSGGYDEMENLCKNFCINKYKCAGEQNICVHVGNVCNQHPDCPLSDDETLCHIQRVICPSHCYCLLHAIQCKNNHENEIIFRYPETYILVLF